MSGIRVEYVTEKFLQRQKDVSLRLKKTDDSDELREG